ncbi:MAG: anti-sigma factor domain-containing protein [Dehalococcoidia bacterium]
MTCADIDDLAGAYAVGALPADELTQFEAHLASCLLPHEELVSLVEGAALLAYACDEVLPPPALVDQILARASSNQQQIPLPAKPVSVNGWKRPQTPVRRGISWMSLAAIAAALALLSIGLGVWGSITRRDLNQQQAREMSGQAVLSAVVDGTVFPFDSGNAGRNAVLIQPRDGSPAYLLEQLPRAESGKRYQVWVISSGRPVSAGLFQGSPDKPEAIRLSSALNGAQAVAVTLEPFDGSVAPSGPEILKRSLT